MMNDTTKAMTKSTDELTAARGGDSVPPGTFRGGDSVPPGTFRGGDSVPPGTFRGGDSVPPGTFRGGDSVPPGTFRGGDSVPPGTFRGGDSVPPGTFRARERRTDLEHYHSKGQRDSASERGYNEPNPRWIFNGKRETEQNKAYKAGWRNDRKTRR